jgi:hypothetical protein
MLRVSILIKGEAKHYIFDFTLQFETLKLTYCRKKTNAKWFSWQKIGFVYKDELKEKFQFRIDHNA